MQYNNTVLSLRAAWLKGAKLNGMKKQQDTDNIAYTEAFKRLLSDVPEISGVYKQEQLKWGSEPIPPHVVYGSIFSDFLRQVVLEGTLDTGHSRSDIISRSFELVEKLSRSTDFQTRCIVEASILESLLGQNSNDWARFSPFFGKYTLEMASRVAEKMGITVKPRRR